MALPERQRVERHTAAVPAERNQRTNHAAVHARQLGGRDRLLSLVQHNLGRADVSPKGSRRGQGDRASFLQDRLDFVRAAFTFGGTLTTGHGNGIDIQEDGNNNHTYPVAYDKINVIRRQESPIDPKKGALRPLFRCPSLSAQSETLIAIATPGWRRLYM